jgi:hypothetical protein
VNHSISGGTAAEFIPDNNKIEFAEIVFDLSQISVRSNLNRLRMACRIRLSEKCYRPKGRWGSDLPAQFFVMAGMDTNRDGILLIDMTMCID